MNLKPINGLIIVEQLEAKEQTSGGIILTEKEEQLKGTVVASDSEQIKVGDTVIYKPYSGFEIEQDKKKFLFIDPIDIFATENK